MTLKELKKDLRRIQRCEKVLKSKQAEESQCRERIEYLKKKGHPKNTEARRYRTVKELERTIELLNIPEYIKQAHMLKNKYIGHIDKLEELDQELINMCYINYSGTQAEIAKRLNYSTDWLKKHLHEACEKLCEVINNVNTGEGA